MRQYSTTTGVGVTEAQSRRKFRRISCQQEIVLKPRNLATAPGFLHNVSEGGAFMLCPDVYFPGTKLVIYMPLPLGRQKRICMLSGVVLRTEPIEQSFLRGYGVRFDREIPSMSRKILKEFLGEKTDVPAKEDAPVPKVQTYVQLATWGKRIRELETGKRLVPATAGVWQPLLWKILLSLVLVVGGVKLGGYMYRSVREPIVLSRLVEVLPFQKGEFVGDRLSIVMSDEWVKVNSAKQKRASLEGFAQALQGESVYEAVLLDKEGRAVALILHNSGDRKKPGIRVLSTDPPRPGL